jgi:hypothetical protein
MGGDDVAATGIVVLTFTVTVAEAQQAPAAVPVTVYSEVVDGDTVMDEPDKFPGIQLYVAPPEAVSTEDWPGQISVGSAVAVMNEAGRTITVSVL